MSKNFKRNTQKQAKEAKSCIKVSSRNITRPKHAKQNVLKSLTNAVNQNCSQFVMLNKTETFKNLHKSFREN